MEITLLSKTENAIKVAFTAIRTCYSPETQDYIWNEGYDKYSANNDDHLRLIRQIVNHGHTSTLEHINFTFAINGVSRSLLAQLTRHRIGYSYSVQSQRYVKFNSGGRAVEENEGFEYVTPPSFVDAVTPSGASVLEQYEMMMTDMQAMYDFLVACGIPAEDARYVLPNAATTNITVTINLRALLDGYGKRNPNTHAQWEIAELFERLRKIVETEEPWTAHLFEDLFDKER